MKKFLIILVVFGLGVIHSYAKLEQTEEQLKYDHPSTQIAGVRESDRVKWIVFEEEGGEFAAMILDGKVEAEFRRNYDDSKIDKEKILQEMRQYSENWEPINSGSSCTLAAISVDGRYLAKVGCMETIGSKFVFVVYTKKAYDYAKASVNGVKI